MTFTGWLVFAVIQLVSMFVMYRTGRRHGYEAGARDKHWDWVSAEFDRAVKAEQEWDRCNCRRGGKGGV